MEQRQSQSPESVAPNVRVRNPIGQRSVTGEHSTGCRETRKRRQRVSHPSEAGRRIKEPGGKQKVNNKESVTLEGESRNPGETESQQQRVSHP